MPTNMTKLEESQSQAAELQESQISKAPKTTEEYLDQLKRVIAEKDQTIAQLRKDCTYYEKAVLAFSRSKITADQLAQWLSEEPGEGLTLEEVIAELKRPQKAS